MLWTIIRLIGKSIEEGEKEDNFSTTGFRETNRERSSREKDSIPKIIGIQKLINNKFHLLNFDFNDSNLIKYFNIDSGFNDLDETQLVFETKDLNNAGKQWIEEHFEIIKSGASEGKSFIEIVINTKRKPEAVYKKMHDLDLSFSYNKYEGTLDLFLPNDQKINYNPKNILNGNLEMVQEWFSSSLYLNFPLPVLFKARSELEIEVYINDEFAEKVMIDNHLMNYKILKVTNWENKKIKLYNKHLGSLTFYMKDFFKLFEKSESVNLFVLKIYKSILKREESSGD